MASGIIMGHCARCEELVWEDEWTLDRHDQFVHDYDCKPANPTELAKRVRDLEEQVEHWRERALRSERELKSQQMSLFLGD